jgi:hypothetical protein
MGGDISVVSAEGHGACFTVRLPVQVRPQPGQPGQPAKLAAFAS